MWEQDTKVLKFEPATLRLLQEKNLRCVCQLCDCGKRHLHPGCVLKAPAKSASNRPGLKDARSSYQEMFPEYKKYTKAQSCRPLLRQRNPHPPPMDFRTVQRTEYLTHATQERQKPCKLITELRPNTGPFNFKSVYQGEFVQHQSSSAKLIRPDAQRAIEKAKFHTATTYSKEFQANCSGTEKEKPFPEQPSTTYGLLYPDTGIPVEQKSFTNSIHKGHRGEVLPKCKPCPSTIAIGREGAHDHQTVNMKVYTPKQINLVKNYGKKEITSAVEKPRFQGTTQHQSDFTLIPDSKPAKLITPPPSLIDLKYDKSRYLQTTNMENHKILWDKSNYKLEKAIKKQDEQIKSTEPFTSKSVTQKDFMPYEIQPRQLMKPISFDTRNNEKKVKFHDQTSYQKQFLSHSRPNIVRYKPFRVGDIYLTPQHKFYNKGSVTTRDYKPVEDFIPSESFKPIKEAYESGEFDGQTTYNQTYKNLPMKICKLNQFLEQNTVQTN